MGDHKCGRCGKDPAAGLASVWTPETGEVFYCHGDDDESPTCYEKCQWWWHPIEEEGALAELIEMWDW